ncbi:MAG: D-glycerate dehydrogenase [Elusimicrobiota bacterium]|nr:D-glycerate dehydrogenase [Elusimicrobiota bacterium]
MKKVLVTRQLPQPAIDLLKQYFEVDLYTEDRVIPREELLRRVEDKDGLLCLLTDNVDAELMDKAKNLKVIANYAVGYNNIDVAEATKRKIPVTNTPGVLTETTADLAFALLMSVARRIVESDKFLREGKFKGWAPMLFLGNDIYGKTLGIIGFGRIGQAVAKRGLGFDMKILYYDTNRVSVEIEQKYNATFKPLDELLKESDFISIHVPLVKETYHLISDREFSLMKPTAYLINTSRGPVVDEKALVRALKDKKIAGAALDVFEKEPEVEPELIDMPNTVLVPHIGSATIETRTKMALMAAENIIAVLVHNKVPPNIVNPEIYK